MSKLELIPGKYMLTSENYANTAERLMRGFMEDYSSKPDKEKLSTSKLRGIYAMVMNVYTRANSPQEYQACKSDIQYLRVRMAYEAGREPVVRSFLLKTRLMDVLGKVETYDQFMLYCRYAESLVAYFKFFGGKDQ